MKLLLDANILTRLCHPAHEENRPLSQWLEKVLGLSGPGVSVCIPEIVDYEVRRGLLHVALRSGRSLTKSLLRLDLLNDSLEYIPLNTQTMRRAAGLWAEARHSGQPTAPEEALDGDVILAAQALEVAGLVVTENTRHLSRFAPAYRWQESASQDLKGAGPLRHAPPAVVKSAAPFANLPRVSPASTE